ncbi:MAG: phosphoglucosamine mutase [Acidimicrobiales bacterium]
MTLKFGTDGVRGVANLELTPELALSFGRAAADVLGPAPRFVVGSDTRRSSPMLAAAFSAGVAARGIDVVDLGLVPTPAVAWVCAGQGVPGAVVSASHNPFADNGIKLFAPGGRKLTDDVEERIEALIEASGPGKAGPPGVPVGASVGSVTVGRSLADGWAASVAGSLGGRRLRGLAVVLDCANGAASGWAPRLFQSLGARVYATHTEPDGTNINQACGATHLGDLQRAVIERGAGLGVAFDGDADRCLAVDHRGEVVDGDQILAVLAIDRHDRGALAGDTVVVTVMSNLGFRRAMAERGITVVETQVGDRYVLDALDAGGFVLGGEQSGHVIQRDLATTGDGILTGIHLCDAVQRADRPLAELAAVMRRLPQVLRNVHLPHRDPEVVDAVAADVAAAEAELDGRGRVLIRTSGTEPLVRVMVEADTEQRAAELADRLVAAVEAAGTRTRDE